ncbi:MAG: PKD domain-containing protein [Alistipes finegoldii]
MFGDGATATSGAGESAEHTYRTAGTYTVRATVTRLHGPMTEPRPRSPSPIRRPRSWSATTIRPVWSRSPSRSAASPACRPSSGISATAARRSA